MPAGLSGVIETQEGLQAMAEADRELEDVEDWEKIPLETEDFSKMEELE